MKIVAWDIEAGSLNADYGLVLCVGFKEVGKGKPEVPSILDYMGKKRDVIEAERRLLIETSERLLAADIWLTHYGSRGRYDLPFVQSRLLYHGLPILPPKHPQIDTWKIAKNDLKLHNNRLVTLQEFFGVKDEKNPIKGEQWIRALSGDAKAMGYIVEHCRRDVLVLEQVYEVIKPLMTDHPNRGLIDGRGGCSCCGAKRLVRRGFHVTRTRKYRRLQCMDCGSWSKETKPVETATNN